MIKFVSDLREVDGFFHQKYWQPRYSWNIVESVIKHHNPWMFRYSASFSIQGCRSRCAPLYLCQRSFYKIFVKFRNSKKNVLKIVLIIVNINKDENKLLISNQFSLKNDFPPLLGELFCGGKNSKWTQIIFKRELIWNEWFIFIFIDIYNN